MLCQFVFFFIAHRRLKKKQPSYFCIQENISNPTKIQSSFYKSLKSLTCYMQL